MSLVHPIVSICMITYRHEKFIEEAINGVLMQDCNFEIELIIANDCSPDRTDEIIQNILQKHPRSSPWITYIKHEKNIGMMPNFIYALQQCKGKYIALCEGDDYWTNPLKLKKQVDFLEENTDYVMTFHNANVINNLKQNCGNFSEYLKSDYTPKEILNTWITPTASMVFKNVITTFPLFMKDAVHGDLALRVYLCEYGKVKAFNEVMCVYRINEESITVRLSNDLINNKKLIRQLKLMDSFFYRKYNDEIRNKIFLLELECTNCYRGRNVLKQMLFFIKIVVLNPLFVYSHKANVVNSLKAIGVSFLILFKIKKIQ